MDKISENQFIILAVDDNLNALEIIKRNLENAGYKVITSNSVQAAVEVLKDQKIDLVITDLKMPKHSGLDLVRHVSENYNDVGIIMVTGYPSINGAVEAVKTGVEEFLAKPFTDEELLSAVQDVLEKLKLRRPIYKQTAAYGHFGRNEEGFTWEEIDMVDTLKKNAKQD